MRKMWSMASNRSARNMEASSMMMVSKLSTVLRGSLRRFATSKRLPGFKRKNECTVCPCTLMAEMPVVASTTALRAVCCAKYFKSVVLPVPARPVMKISGVMALLFSKSRSASLNSSVKIISAILFE